MCEIVGYFEADGRACVREAAGQGQVGRTHILMRSWYINPDSRLARSISVALIAEALSKTQNGKRIFITADETSVILPT
jgi:hypothetical protein